MKIITVDTVIEEFRSGYIPLFPHSSVELLIREIERLRKIVEVQKVEIEQLQKSHANSNLLSTLIPDHTKDILDGLRKDTWKWTESEGE